MSLTLTRSRLPDVGTTIFTVMSALAQQHQAVNLGQGFPDFDADPALLNAVADAMHRGENQYAPMAGLLSLREAVSRKIHRFYGLSVDPVHEVTITAGATQAILTAILALVHPGDEVIVLDPCYDSYAPNIALAGAKAVHVPLLPETFRPDFNAISDALNKRTAAIIVNTPHNPTASVWTEADMLTLAQLLTDTRVVVIADEVYEHMVFDGQRHESVSRHPELAERSIVVSSFGKTFHVTGWKVGHVSAPRNLMEEFRKVHQFNVFCVNTPMQAGLAVHLNDPTHCESLPAFYQRKRDLFREGLRDTPLRLLHCEGTYFQCVDYAAVSDLSEEEFCRWLTVEKGVAAIPLAPFYQDRREQRLARFCFAKRDVTLEQAIERLSRL